MAAEAMALALAPVGVTDPVLVGGTVLVPVGLVAPIGIAAPDGGVIPAMAGATFHPVAASGPPGTGGLLSTGGTGGGEPSH